MSDLNNESKSVERRAKKYGSLAEKDESGILIYEWYQPLNGERTPYNTPYNYSKPVYWKCSKCGYIWAKPVNARMRGLGCRMCAQKKATDRIRNINVHLDETNFALQFPYESEEWDYEKNGDCSPNQFSKSDKRIVYWKCSVCGNVYQESIRNRSRGSGCKLCKKRLHTSFPEQALFYYVQKVYPDAINSYKDIFAIRGMELDIYIPSIKTGIEYDGSLWHLNRATDKQKFEICKQSGIKLIRVIETLSKTTLINCDQYIRSVSKHFYSSKFDTVIGEVLNAIGSKDTVDVSVVRDLPEIHKRYVTSLKMSSLKYRFPDVAIMWHPTANDELTPEMFSPSSEAIVWWKCPDCGNEWQESIEQVVKSPFCCQCEWLKGTRRSFGIVGSLYNLKNHYPEIEKEWDYKKNGELRPNEITDGCKRKVHWICSKCGSSYIASIKSRTTLGSGCPECKRRSLSKVVHERTIKMGLTVSSEFHLMELWNYDKNKDLNPDNLARNSNEVVWWKCPKCGYEWENKITLVYNGSGCKRCSAAVRSRKARISRLKKGQSLKDLYPILTSEWDYNKNEDPPELYSPESKEQVYWICPQCHTSYIESVTRRVHKHGCLNCGYGDIVKHKYGILQIDIETGEELNRYATAKEAAATVHIDPSGILKACRGKQESCGGYRWKFDKPIF